MYNSRISRIENAKFSWHCFCINTNVQGNFQICIGVSLTPYKTVNTATVIQGTEIPSHNQGFHLLNGIYNMSILYDGYFGILKHWICLPSIKFLTWFQVGKIIFCQLFTWVCFDRYLPVYRFPLGTFT